MLLQITIIQTFQNAWLSMEVFQFKSLLHNGYALVVMEIICSIDIRLR
jgi:hypothetical protein